MEIIFKLSHNGFVYIKLVKYSYIWKNTKFNWHKYLISYGRCRTGQFGDLLCQINPQRLVKISRDQFENVEKTEKMGEIVTNIH